MIKIKLKNNNGIDTTKNEKYYSIEEVKKIKEKIKQNGAFLKDIEYQTDEIKWYALKITFKNIQYIKNPSEEMCMFVIKKNGLGLEYIKNPSVAVQLEAVKVDGFAIQFISNPTEEMQLEAVKNCGMALEYMKNPSEAVQLEAVKQDVNSIEWLSKCNKDIYEVINEKLNVDLNLIETLEPSKQDEIVLSVVKKCGAFIRFIENPNEDMQQKAVKQKGDLIRFITNPFESVKWSAIKRNGNAIQYIKNPSEEMKFYVVGRSGLALQYIENPSEEIQLEAVKKNFRALQYIENPSEAVQLEAVKHQPLDFYTYKEMRFPINYIKNPSEAVQLEAVKVDGIQIQFIENPSEAVQLEAVKQKGKALQYIENPSEAVQLEAVKNTGLALAFIENPTEEMQLEAVKEDGNAIRYIKNPSDEIKLEAVKQNGMALRYIKNPTEDMQLIAVNSSCGYACMDIDNPSQEVLNLAIKWDAFWVKKVEGDDRENYISVNWEVIFYLSSRPSEKALIEALLLCDNRRYDRILSTCQGQVPSLALSLVESGILYLDKSVANDYINLYKGNTFSGDELEKYILNMVYCFEDIDSWDSLYNFICNTFNFNLNLQEVKEVCEEIKTKQNLGYGVISALIYYVLLKKNDFVVYYNYYKKVINNFVDKWNLEKLVTINIVLEILKEIWKNKNNEEIGKYLVKNTVRPEYNHS